MFAPYKGHDKGKGESSLGWFDGMDAGPGLDDRAMRKKSKEGKQTGQHEDVLFTDPLTCNAPALP